MRHAGIIAAGEGSRLGAKFPGVPKPLVPVSGTPLVHWVARSLTAAGATDILLTHNSRGNAVRDSLTGAFPKVAWDFRTADTANSWETFRLVCLGLAEKADSFLISTVDSIIAPDQAKIFADKVTASKCGAGLALTSFVDDEKPLWVSLKDERVAAIGDAQPQRKLVTCGIYYMTSRVAKELPSASSHDKLRSFWSSLVDSGEPVAGVVLSKTLDVDRPEDIREAEGFLKAGYR